MLILTTFPLLLPEKRLLADCTIYKTRSHKAQEWLGCKKEEVHCSMKVAQGSNGIRTLLATTRSLSNRYVFYGVYNLYWKRYKCLTQCP